MCIETGALSWLIARLMKNLAWLLAAVAACGGSDKAMPDASSSADSGATADSNPPRMPATKFAPQAINFSMPSSGLFDGFCSASSFANTRHWTTTDLDGDGFFEVVHSGDTAFTQRVWDATGNPYWKVYAGGATGWAATALNWTVPTNGRSDGFFAAGATGAGAEWVVLDMDGDKRLDLIQSADPATSTVWDAQGVAHWKVFLGTSSGFATSPVAWRVPASGTTAGFTTTSMRSGNWVWSTFDITKDGKPDLVQTSDPVTGKVWDAASAAHWKVFENTGAGFATSPTLWSVPSSGTSYGFRATTMSSGVEQWVTVDLDLDGRLDIVQTADTATNTVWDAAGAPYWKVFRGTASGFEPAPKTWRVPKSGLSDGFYMARAELSQRRWLLVDLDGDGDLDLVQTGDTAFTRRVWDATGNPYWKVFANTGDGFTDELHRWSVPMGPTDGFTDASMSVAPLNWFVADVDHDGYRDLVHTMNPATSTVWDATGPAYWKVYRGQP
jgi:hypothetical protein